LVYGLLVCGLLVCGLLVCGLLVACVLIGLLGGCVSKFYFRTILEDYGTHQAAW